MSSRRGFIKTMGIAAGAAAILQPEILLGGTSELLSTRNKKKGNVGKRFELRWQPFVGHLKHTFALAGSSRTTTPIVITRLDWNGYTGYGEASMPPYLGESHASVEAFLQKVASEVLPKFDNPFRIEDIMDAVDAIAEKNCAAKAAIDIALHDMTGKIMGQPWWKIWGFNPATTPNTSFTIGYDPDDAVVNQKIDEAAWTKVIKVKVGISYEADRRMINLIRAKTDTPICADANQGWKDREYALDMIGWLSSQGVIFVEQPMAKGNLDDNAWITERSPIPIIADEACQRLRDIPRLKGAFHGINIKLMKCTGMREAREMVTLAEALGMKLMIGCMTETSVAISAAAQISPKCLWADLDGNILFDNDCFEGMKLTDGKITLTGQPGLGVSKIPGTIDI